MLGIFWSTLFVHMYIFMHGFQNKWMPISSVQAVSGTCSGSVVMLVFISTYRLFQLVNKSGLKSLSSVMEKLQCMVASRGR